MLEDQPRASACKANTVLLSLVPALLTPGIFFFFFDTGLIWPWLAKTHYVD